MNSTIRLAAVGDLLMTTRPGAEIPGRDMEALSDEIKDLFASCDIVLTNLECTLPGSKTVATEPRVFTTEKQIKSLAAAGITAVTLGNNHAFDAFDEGFQRLTGLLTNLEVPWFGAGPDLNAASAPAIIKKNGIAIAILGVVDASSGMQRFAKDDASGVAPLEMDQLCRQIGTLRTQVDHVIITPHWGDERFRFPAPLHIHQAHALVAAGASLILGHHPHVLQGMEIYREAPIVYSLGNFLANHVYWDSGDFLTWNRFERTSCIMIAVLGKTGISTIRQIPVFDDGEKIRIEKSGWGDHCINKANQLLAAGVTEKKYRQERFRVRTLKPIIDHLNWSRLSRLGPADVGKLLRLFKT